MCFSSKEMGESSERGARKGKFKPKARHERNKSKKVDAVTDDENTDNETSDDSDDEMDVYSVTDQSKDD